MSIEPNPPTLPRRVLGRRLRELRETAGLSRAHAARRCEMGAQTLWRLESGRNSEVKKMVLNALCDAYEASADDRLELLWLVDESRKPGWWHACPEAVEPKAEVYFGLEQAAQKIFSWQTTTLPGLVQTSGYRRAMWKVAEPLGRSISLDSEIDVLRRRQERLQDSSDFSIEIVLSESVLRNSVGGADIMADQLIQLIEMSQLPNLSMRVVPWSTPNYLGMTAKHFVYLEFPEHPNPTLTEPPVVYVEGFTGSLYLDRPCEISQYQQARASIRHVALDERDSRRLIEATAREYRV